MTEEELNQRLPIIPHEANRRHGLSGLPRRGMGRAERSRHNPVGNVLRDTAQVNIQRKATIRQLWCHLVLFVYCCLQLQLPPPRSSLLRKQLRIQKKATRGTTTLVRRAAGSGGLWSSTQGSHSLLASAMGWPKW